MSIKENDNQIYTKYYDDPITNYLRNIIQRYFEIEYDNSIEKREAFLIKALILIQIKQLLYITTKQKHIIITETILLIE